MRFKKAQLILVIVLAILFSSSTAWAAFGISPPFVKSNKLIPGSHYEQRIILSRSEADADRDAQAQITIDAPEIESWLSIDQGFSFILPKGEKQVPMFVKVDVPKDAELRNYKGHIHVKVVPAEGAGEGGVAIALGAQIDIDLTVVKDELSDFLVRSVNVLDSVKKGWPMKYFNEIRVPMNIENTGNVIVAPTRVHLDVYDIITRKNLLESKDDTKFKEIKPFETEEIFAEFFTELEVGEYFAEVKIFKGDEVVKEWKAIFSVKEGAFSVKDWIILICSGIGILIILIGIGYKGYRIWKKKKVAKI